MAAAGTDTKPWVILLADGNRLSRVWTASSLRKQGMKVINLSKPARMAKVLKSGKGCLMIYDLDAPSFGGPEALAKIKAEAAYKNLKVIGITKRREKDFLLTSLRSGVNQIIISERLSIVGMIKRIESMLSEDANKRKRWCPSDVAIQAAKSERPTPFTTEFLSDKVRHWASANPLKPLAKQLLTMLNEGTATQATLASLVRNDEETSKKMVQIANSPAFLREKTSVKSIADAMRVMGPGNTLNAAIIYSISRQFRSQTEEDSLPGLWGHSLSCGLCAEALARYTKWCDPGQALAAGLLHDIGRRWLSDFALKHYAHVLVTDCATASGLCGIEKMTLGTDHAWVGSKLLEAWGVGSFVAKVVGAHDIARQQQDEWRSQTPGLLKVLALADSMSTAFGYEADPLEELIPIPRWWIAQVTGQLEFRDQTAATLQDQLKWLAQLCELQVREPEPWRGSLNQIIILGQTLSPIEPLQHVLTHAYSQAEVHSIEMCKPDVKRTLVIVDLRDIENPNLTDLLAKLPAADVSAKWPVLVVGNIGPALVASAAGKRPYAVVSPPLRLPGLQTAAETLIQGMGADTENASRPGAAAASNTAHSPAKAA